MKKEEYAKRVEEIKHSLYRVAYGYMNEEAAAMDALDEAIYKGYLHRKKMKQQEYFKTWMTRIVINECLQKIRKDKRLVFLEQIPDEEVTELDHLPLKEALRHLPDELHTIILLRYFGGYTLAEVSEILNVPLSTVAGREKRALSLLRIELRDE